MEVYAKINMEIICVNVCRVLADNDAKIVTFAIQIRVKTAASA